jgi:hypothetical protein
MYSIAQTSAVIAKQTLKNGEALLFERNPQPHRQDEIIVLRFRLPV